MKSDEKNTDHKLEKRIAETLDKSLDDIKEATLADLADARAKALATQSNSATHKQKNIYRYAMPAIAATALIAAMTPMLLKTLPSKEEPIALSYLDVDPEMLEVMDLLMDLGALADDPTDAI